MCGRTVNEISNELSGKTKAELGIESAIEKAETEKKSFVEKISPWPRQIPREYSNFEYDFVIANPDQFNSISYFAELKQFELLVLGGIAEAKYRAELGDEVSLGDVSVSHSDRSSLLQAIKDFEKKEGQDIRGSGRHIDPMNFQGLKFGDGIAYLQRLGIFYYDQQIDIMKRELSRAALKKAAWKLNRVKFNDAGNELWVCTVCDRIIRKFSAENGTSFSFDEDYQAISRRHHHY
jgi:hypothetical protein